MGSYQNSFFNNFIYEPTSINLDYEVWNFLYEMLWDKYYKNEIPTDKFIEVLEYLYDYQMPSCKSYKDVVEKEKYEFSISSITNMIEKLKKEKNNSKKR